MSVYIVKRTNKKAKPTYHVRWSRGKYEPYVYLGKLDTKARAEMRRNKCLDLLALGIPPTLEMFKHSAPEAEKVRLEEAAKAYCEAQSQWGVKTRIVREGIVRGIVAYFGPRTVPGRITVDDVQRYIAAMQKEGAKVSYIKTRLSVLARLLDHAKHPDNPVRSRLLNKPRGRVEHKMLPTVAALAAVRALLPLHEQRFMDVLEHGGARYSEALGVRVCDLNGDEMVVNGTKTDGSLRIVSHLAGQPAWIPAKPEGAAGSDLIFEDCRIFNRHLTAACKKAGVPQVNPHLLRHLHASRILQGDKPGGLPTTLGVADMAARMGHTVDEFQKTYTHRIPPEA